MSAAALTRLRALMAEHRVAAYYVPTDDAHLSEYVADCDARRAFISGFTGSAGTAVVTAAAALLWTDGRYFLQAGQQLDGAHWSLMRSGAEGVPTVLEWLRRSHADARVGYDPFTVSAETARQLREACGSLEALPCNLVDAVWGDARPARTRNAVVALPEGLTGQSVTSKVDVLRSRMRAAGCTAMIVSALDEVAWLTNLRGSDIAYNPVFTAYALVTLNDVRLFVDREQVAGVHLDAIRVEPYESIGDAVAEVSGQPSAKVWVDANRLCDGIYRQIKGAVHRAMLPTQSLKAVKNAAEIAGMRLAHLKDGAALTSFFAWLEEAVARGETLSECDAADRVEALRREQENFVTPSFATISSSGPNGAVIHYKPEPATCRRIDAREIFLLDSGGQYLEGTTDTTRTVAFTAPSAFQKQCYTLVLKGHLHLARVAFPANAVGIQLDAVARLYLWEAGLDYVHGTGHGVGCYLNVHEGPQLISNRNAPSTMYPICEGMMTSNEPGYYQDGEFGIRIENVAVVQSAGRSFLRLHDLTLVPYDARLIDGALLTPVEREQINAYHARCLHEVLPFVKDERGRAWLARRTRPLDEQLCELA